MHMITMRLVSSGPSNYGPDDLTEQLAVNFTPADRVEHLWTRASPGQIDIVFFLLADCEADALLTARAACLRTIERLGSWRLADDPK